MKNYLIHFNWMQPYPKEFEVREKATSMATATNRAIRKWKKQHGRGVKAITIKVLSLGSTE